MGQMAITGVHTCHFVVWTTKDFHVQTIHFDFDLWINTCSPKLKHFYFFFMLPEILYPNLSSPHDFTTSVYQFLIFLSLLHKGPWKLDKNAHTKNIWSATQAILFGISLSSLKFVILPMACSTCLLIFAILHVIVNSLRELIARYHWRDVQSYSL